MNAMVKPSSAMAQAFLTANVETRTLPVDKLFVEPEYGRQRPPPPASWIEARSGKHYKPWAMRPLEVATLDDEERYAIIDGQGRHLLALTSGIKELECRVHSKLSPEQRCLLFLELNDVRKLRAIDMFRSKVGAGERPATKLYETMKEAGFEVGGQGKFGIGNVATLEHVVEDFGLGTLKRAATISRKAWPVDNKQCKPAGIHIAGTAIFITATDPLDEDGLVKVLAKNGPKAMMMKIREGNGGQNLRTDHWPMAIAAFEQKRYNLSRRMYKSDPGALEKLRNGHWQ